MIIKHILGFGSIFLFFSYFFFSKYPEKSYLVYVLLLLPFMDLKLTPEEFGHFSVFDFITYFILIYSIKDFFNFSIKNNKYFFLLIILIGILFIGSIKSEFFKNSLFNLFRLLSIFIFSKILINECTKDFNFVKLVIRSLKLSCLLSLVFLLIQLIIGTGFTFYPDLNSNVYIESDAIRYPSYFQDPQKYAQYLSMLSFLFLMNKENKLTPGLSNVLFFILVVLAVMLTGGRSAFLGLSMGLLIIIFSQKYKIRIIAFFCCLVGYFILTNFGAYISLFNRGEDFNISYDLRNQIWKEALDIFVENPFLGIGIGNHHNYVVNHSVDGYYIVDNEIQYYGTENGYLQILVEYGLFGFIAVFLFLIIPIIDAIKSYSYFRNYNVVFLIASVVSWMIAYNSVNSLGDMRVLVLLVTLICLLVVSKKSSKAIHV